MFIPYCSVEGSICAQACVVSIQSHNANYWPGMHAQTFLAIFACLWACRLLSKRQMVGWQDGNSSGRPEFTSSIMSSVISLVIKCIIFVCAHHLTSPMISLNLALLFLCLNLSKPYQCFVAKINLDIVHQAWNWSRVPFTCGYDAKGAWPNAFMWRARDENVPPYWTQMWCEAF